MEINSLCGEQRLLLDTSIPIIHATESLLLVVQSLFGKTYKDVLSVSILLSSVSCSRTYHCSDINVLTFFVGLFGPCCLILSTVDNHIWTLE